MGASTSVDGELARLKGELGQAEAPKEIGGATAGQVDGQRPATTEAQRPTAEDGA
jgi:hypothetical protein